MLVVACLAANLTPGPSVLLVTSVSAVRGFTAVVFTQLGMNAGVFVHVVLAASGVAALLATAPMLFDGIRYLGAAYLVYLGIDLIRKSRVAAGSPDCGGADARWQYFRRGLLVDALNPRVALFFLAFIPQFLGSIQNPGLPASIALGSAFLLTGTIVDLGYTALAALGARRADGRFEEWIRCRIPGTILIVPALRLLWRNPCIR